MGHRGLEHIRHIHMVVDIVGDIRTLQALFLGLNKEALHLTVEAMPHQFEGDIGIAIDTRRLALGCEERKNLVDVGHIKVATQTEVLGAPIVTTQEGVHILQTTLTRGGIAQMTHVELTLERLIDMLEHLGNGVLALGLLTEHIFLASRGIEVHTAHASTFLTTVMLFLHHQVELVKSVAPRTVFLFVVAQRLQ